MVQDPQRLPPGQSMVEIGVLIALVAAVAVASLQVTGTSVSTIICRVVSTFGGSCGALLRDDFADLDAWQRVSGQWDSVNGELCGGPGEGRIFAPISANDYTIDLDTARLMQGNGYGVFFRTEKVVQVNGYSFQYDPGLGGFVIRKWVNGNEISTPIARAHVSGYAWHNANRKLQLTVSGDTFTVHLDGQPVLTTTDRTYPTGGMGFRTWDSTRACFDNLSVHSLR